jgi:hypothetical protein
MRRQLDEETLLVLARVAESKERLRNQSRPVPYTPRQVIVEEETMAAGQRRQRALCLVEKLYRDRAITYEEYAAAGILRNQIMMEGPPSEGVSSYGNNIRASEPSAKGDRIGRRLTGYEVLPDGTLSYPGGRKSRANERRLEDAIFAAVGLHMDGDHQHRRVVNVQHYRILERAILDSEGMPTLTELTLELTGHYGAKSKQAPPYSLGVLQTILGRLARHYGLVSK